MGGHGGVPNLQPRHCLLNRLVRRRSKKTSKLRVTGLCAGGNSPGTGEFPAHKWPVTRKMVPFDDVIMYIDSMSCSWKKTHLFVITKNVHTGNEYQIYLKCHQSNWEPIHVFCSINTLDITNSSSTHHPPVANQWMTYCSPSSIIRQSITNQSSTGRRFLWTVIAY